MRRSPDTRGALTLSLVVLASALGAGCHDQPRAWAQTSDEVASDQPSSSSGLQVAITIDDLPLADFDRYGSAARRAEVVQGLCDLIRARGIPVTGFINMVHDASDPALMPLWLEAGIALGNHTWSHPHLREVGIEAYLEDLDRGYEALRPLAGDGVAIPFRYPYLFEGFVPAEHDRIRARLAELGSPMAPVTIDSMDWYYARGYIEAQAAGDEAAVGRWVQSWRWNLEEATEYAELLAGHLFESPPPQILLIHANALNADHLGEYLDWMAERGYTFISLTEALAHPAFSELDASLSPIGESHWLRLRRSRQLLEGSGQ